MVRLLKIFILLLLSANVFSQSITLTVGKQYAAQTVAGIVNDDGYYNAFSMPDTTVNSDIVSVSKKSGSHAAAGPMMINRSSDGGATWSEQQIVVDGDSIECAALSFKVLSTGRWVIAYQDDTLYVAIKFAYSDDAGVSFTSAGTVTIGAGYSSSPSPIKFIEMPSGKVRFAYYAYGIGANPSIVGFMNSTDEGESWAVGENIISNTSDHPTNFGDWKGHEAGIVITHNTGIDSTCKMIALIRVAMANEGGTYYMHYKSADGGVTWATDMTEDAGTLVDDNGNNVSGPFSRHLFYRFLATNSPVDIMEHNGLIYVANGVRSVTAYSYKLAYTTATPDQAYANVFSSWTASTSILTANAATLGGSIDFGYPVLFKRQGKLWCHYYDVSTETKDPLITEDRCWIRQVKITD